MDQAKVIKCPDCGREMSAKALSCPHCSVLLTESQRVRMQMTEAERAHMQLTESQRVRKQMEEAQRARTHKSSLTTLVMILGVCLSLLLGLFVSVFAQSGKAAIGAVLAGVGITYFIATMEK